MKVLFTRVVERLVVFKDSVKSWVKTNWTKITEKIGNIIVSQSVVYSSRCWNCKQPIKSVKTEQKFIGWVQNKWLGNKKCSKYGCNYFICNNCGKCLCDGPYAYKKGQKPVMTKWQTEEKTSKFGIIKEYFKSKKGE